MKRSRLLRHLRRHGCHLKREGSAHSLWTNPKTGVVEAIPRHVANPGHAGSEDLSSALGAGLLSREAAPQASFRIGTAA